MNNQDFIEVQLTQGYIAIIDADDAERVCAHKWSVYINAKNRITPRIYAQSGLKRRKGERVYLHRFIMGEPKGFQIDHINNNGLDCRKSNLRLATNSQNHCNMKSSRPSTTGFRGVTVKKYTNTFYIARISFNGKRCFIGSFSTPEEAARAYDAKAIELHGEFATLNFPDEIFSRRASVKAENAKTEPFGFMCFENRQAHKLAA